MRKVTTSSAVKHFATVAVAVLALSACSPDTAPTDQAKEAVGVASMVDENNRDYPDFRALEQALETDPTTVIPREAVDLVGGSEALDESIPEDTEFLVRDKTWAPDGTGGTVKITVKYADGSKSQKLAILLQDVKQRWYVLQTLPLDAIPKELGS